MPLAVTWMDLHIIILSEVLQTMINITGYPFYVVSRKMIQMNLFTKQKQSHRKQIFGYQRGEQRGAGEEGERDKLGVWESHLCEMGILRLTLWGCSEAVHPCSKEQECRDKGTRYYYSQLGLEWRSQFRSGLCHLPPVTVGSKAAEK